MTYRELLLQAELKLDINDITLGEFEQMIAPLNREVDVLDKIRAKIESHCGLTKENHCKYCSYCNSVMGVREILEIIDKYKAGSEDKE